MITQELITYITSQLNSGRDEDNIKKQLFESNWSQADIDEAFVRIHFQSPNSEKTGLNLLLSPSQLFQSSWALYKKKFKGILIMVIFFRILSLPILLPVPIINSLYAVFVGYWIIVFSISFLSDENLKPDFKSHIIKSLKLIIPFYILFFLSTLIYLGGWFLFIIPGLIYLIWFSLSSYVLVIDNLKGLNALFISRELVRGRFGEVFIRVFAIGSFFIVFSFLIIGFPLIIKLLISPQTFLASLNASTVENLTNQQIPLNFFLNAIQHLVVLSIFQIYMIILYKNAKQAYGRSFPLPSRKSRFMLILPGIFGFLLVFLSVAILGYMIAFDPLKRFQMPKTPNTRLPIPTTANKP